MILKKNLFFSLLLLLLIMTGFLFLHLLGGMVFSSSNNDNDNNNDHNNNKSAITNNETDELYNKVMCGYQGWFGAPGDNLANGVSWYHWCVEGTEPTPDTITIDTWPDYSEYHEESLFYPKNYDWFYPSGKKAGFFSSNLEETVLLHCKWMRDYGIDGVFLQRFTNLFNDHRIKIRYGNVLRHMLKGAEQYGLKVVIMYDVSATNIRNISSLLEEDWMYLVDVMKLPDHPCYQYHHDKNGERLPVVAVWGLGFIGVGSRGQARSVINFFKHHSNPNYRATLMGGVPAYWRSGTRDAKTEYEEIFAGFDIISPWTVGRFRDEWGAEKWSREMIAEDIQLTESRGQDYLPVCFPGFSNSNLWKNLLSKEEFKHSPWKYFPLTLTEKPLKGELNSIPRNGGHFMWKQFYHWKQAGAKMLYIAMFDEVDEGTAIFKIAPNAEYLPNPTIFLSLDRDGYPLKSDHFLWMTGNAGFIIKHNLPFPKIQPTRFPEHSFNVNRVREKAWIVEKHFGRIDITMNDAAVSRMIIYKKENHGVFMELKTIHREELQDSTYTYIDEFIAEDKNYTYMLVAFDADGIPIGFSDRKTI
jgi:hypothetical protein